MDNNQPTPPALPNMPQRRIPALSRVGDNVWNISEPVLYWMLENGDEDLSRRAMRTLLAWEENQGWFIKWGNDTRYFELAELACRNLHNFKETIKLLPAENEGMGKIIKLALMTGEQFNKPQGIGRTNILKWKKQRRGKRR